jgi:hypothetical protein
MGEINWQNRLISPIVTPIRTLKIGRTWRMISPIRSIDLWQLVRHEVVSITVKSARADLHPLFHQRFPTGTCGIGNDPVRSCRNNVTVRHEVAIITVKLAYAGLHPLFHQRFPTDTCWIGNDLVRRCRNNVIPPNGGYQPARSDGDCQPQSGRGLGNVATRSRVNHCEACMRGTSPAVPPAVSYWHVRSW